MARNDESSSIVNPTPSDSEQPSTAGGETTTTKKKKKAMRTRVSINEGDDGPQPAARAAAPSTEFSFRSFDMARMRKVAQLKNEYKSGKRAELMADMRQHPASRQFGLSERGMSFDMPTAHDAMYHIWENYGVGHWRDKVTGFLLSHGFQKFLVSLLILDVVILFVELFLSAEFPPCSIVERAATSCCPALNGPDAEEHHDRWLAGGGDDHHEPLCEYPYEESEIEVGCDQHSNTAVVRAEEALFALTMLILSIFLVELLLLMIALKPQIFFRQAFYVLDFVVVSVSFALELAFHLAGEDVLSSMSGLLIVARLWRFLRIGHGLVEATHEFTILAQHEILEYAEHCEQLLIANGIDLPDGGPHFCGDEDETEKVKDEPDKEGANS